MSLTVSGGLVQRRAIIDGTVLSEKEKFILLVNQKGLADQHSCITNPYTRSNILGLYYIVTASTKSRANHRLVTVM